MGSEHYCLRWNNHQSNLLGVFSQLLQDESLVDVTLACSEGASIRAHKVVLSACSSYFQSLFLDHPSRHPIVILKDVQFAELRTLVEFMYKGEVNVQYCQLSALLKTAESLKVKGLAEMTNLNSGAETSEVGGSEVDPFQPQDLTPSRTSSEHQPERLTRDEPSPPRASPLMHIRRPRHDYRYELMKHEPRHEQKYESRHEQKFETRTEQKQETRQETRQDSAMHEARPEQDSDPGGKETRQEVKSEVRQHEMKQEPLQDQTTRDPGGKEEPPDEPMWTNSPEDEMSSVHSNCGNSDNLGLNMSINMNNNTPTMLTPNPLELRLGLGSLRSISGEPIAGPSGLPPVQQVPLSLKKEVDWNRLPEDKSGGESSSEYRHPLQEPESYESGGDGRVYPCMFCGVGFPHQSKLTRHMLSHSLETMKYREAVMGRVLPPLSLGGTGAPPGGGGGVMGLEESPLDVECVSVEPGGNVVLCKFCGKSFPDVGSLIAHLPAHTGDRPFKCEFCGKAFKLRHHMKDHCRVHTGERPFRCSLCGKTFSRSTILKAHEKTHYPKYLALDSSPGSSRSGTPLGWPAALLAMLQRRALHHLLPPPSLHRPFLDEPPAPLPHRCPACFAAFPSAWLLERHAALQHPPGPDEKPFVCEQCGQSYRYRSAYVKHREQNHRARLPADKLFTCDVCGMQFRYLKSFKKHRLNHALERLHGKTGEHRTREPSDHVSSTNDVLVGRCGEIDLSISRYRRDLSVTDADDSETESRRTRSEEMEDIDQDDTVDSLVPTNVSETATVEGESDKRQTPKSNSPSIASIPEKPETSFANVSSLADSSVIDSGAGSSTGMHLDTISDHSREHTQESTLSVVSRESLMGPASEASLLSYLRGEPLDRQRERRFACPFCGKCVRSKENLKLHVRKHTGERPFVCLFCGRAFGGKSDLTRHLRIHTGERPYHCEACGKCFARADYLSKHLTTHIHNPR